MTGGGGIIGAGSMPSRVVVVGAAVEEAEEAGEKEERTRNLPPESATRST